MSNANLNRCSLRSVHASVFKVQFFVLLTVFQFVLQFCNSMQFSDKGKYRRLQIAGLNRNNKISRVNASLTIGQLLLHWPDVYFADFCRDRLRHLETRKWVCIILHTQFAATLNITTAIFVRGKRFCSWTRWNGAKLGQDQKVEFKTSFELCRQILFKVLMKVGINFVHFVGTKVSEMKPRVHICIKSPFFLKIIWTDQRLNEYLQTISNFSGVKQNFEVLYKILWY